MLRVTCLDTKACLVPFVYCLHKGDFSFTLMAHIPFLINQTNYSMIVLANSCHQAEA